MSLVQLLAEFCMVQFCPQHYTVLVESKLLLFGLLAIFCMFDVCCLQDPRFGEILSVAEGLDADNIKKAIRKSRVVFNRGGADEQQADPGGRSVAAGLAFGVACFMHCYV
jgi:hypothetical protein